MNCRRHLSVLLVFTGVLGLTACSSTPERTPVPVELTTAADIPGIPDARFWSDEWPKFSLERFESITDSELKANFPATYDKPHNYLAISGGGSNGAFGAGLLAGWADAGTRPEFSMVTGVSTGALTAPFVFLGSDYDDELKKVYTTTTTEDIAKKRSILTAIRSDSMTDTAPLRALIENYITMDMIDAIAVEHKRGRRLFVGTMHMDAGRGMIWNIGAIAASDHPGKAKLIFWLLMTFPDMKQ